MAIDSKDNAKIFVEEIRRIIDQHTQRLSKEKICEIDSVNEDGTLNVYIENDMSNIIHDVVNESRYNFQKGDRGYIYLIGGKLSNAFVFAKCSPKKSDEPSSSNDLAIENIEEQIRKLSSSGGSGGGGSSVVQNLFIRYSEYSDGSDMTEDWHDGQKYIGTMVGEVASSDPSDYDWALFVGPSGESNIVNIPDPGPVTVLMNDNTDYTLTSTLLTSVSVLIPQGVEHGYHAGLNFTSGQTAPSFSIINGSSQSYLVKIVQTGSVAYFETSEDEEKGYYTAMLGGSVIPSYSPSPNKIVQLVVFCDGLCITVYVNEV